ncbi:BMP-binding endothelial regulator protein-like [Physella acuta]|uniref:BMP-binding endothelial regulator protein-like n=1 Tax=Physella acuta TaxID=109671 RepID=UPI0027DC39C8|nr:BMP-binding endothelial regulator protein-like [Physella acuta]
MKISLIVCVLFSLAAVVLGSPLATGCTYLGMHIEEGHTFQGSSCDSCHCSGGQVHCYMISCGYHPCAPGEVSSPCCGCFPFLGK